ncbi:cyclic AMP-responsive element-binding protein 3-like protein 4 [Xenia sp. Carnegie-2017]|uniref:cyclic AMP-responsive element-binding protein 3-like protein 4 n=1 Tax=Xenia sp. Carnegie-2017 TaxID=2897299 RepID=UPI001F035698|nr:cyclic AMP-responsive element-binding protein 3-like protein 4 [Xenia sp. Carnegie-2017]
MPSPSSNALDLESVVDFIHDQCKNQNELENNGKKSINGDVEPMITSLSQPVTILKASAKITPIIITEIKAPTQTTSKEKSKPEQFAITEEEKKLLEEEGHVLPTNVPLTKDEEKLLKKVRRKIKNKVSAQESRRKKKEYIDGLEYRVKTCTDQNRALQQKVSSLEEQNKSLLEELKCLKEHVSPSNHNKRQTSTCILVLFLAFALVAFPFERSTFLRTQSNSVADSYSTMPVRSRTLLEYKEDSDTKSQTTLNISHYLRAFSVVFSHADDKHDVDGYSTSAISFEENKSRNKDTYRDYAFSK